MIAIDQTTAAHVDPAAALAIVLLFAATFVAVGLYVLFKVTDACARWFNRRTRRRLKAADRFLTTTRYGRGLRAIDIFFVISTRASVALYGGLILLFFAPILVTVASLELAAALIKF